MSYDRLRHECEQCGEKFLTPQALQGHLHIHSGDGAAGVINGP